MFYVLLSGKPASIMRDGGSEHVQSGPAGLWVLQPHYQYASTDV